MAIHFQLLFATFLYFLEFCNGIVELSSIISGKAKINGACYLFYNKDGTNSPVPCNVQIYISAGVAIYSAIMTVYHGFGTYTASKDNHIGRTMWVMPWLLINAFLVIVTFICSCTYSVGIYMSCKKIDTETRKMFSCGYDVKEFKPMLIAEISSWISVLLWISLVIIEGVRLRRNRRARAREVYVEPTTSDDVQIGSVIPSA